MKRITIALLALLCSLPLLAVRVPLYLGVSLVEGFVVFRLVKSGAFRRFCQLQPLPQTVPSTSK